MIDPSAEVQRHLDPTEYEQLESFQRMFTDLTEMETGLSLAPQEHREHWQGLYEQRQAEVHASAEGFTALKQLCIGVFAVHEDDAEQRLASLRDSIDLLAKFETDTDWLETEQARITLMERILPAKTGLLDDATKFMGFIGLAPTIKPPLQVEIDSSGLIVGEDIILWEQAYDVSRRGKSPLSKETTITRCYHAARLLFDAQKVTTDAGDEIALINLIVKTICNDPELVPSFTNANTKTPAPIQISTKFAGAVDKVNRLVERHGKPTMFTRIKQDQSMPYGAGYRLNQEYKF
jgi:hypothetical protein